MSRVKLDLNDFKHVSSDDKTTKLKHKHGHFLVLAHKSLSPDAQKQLGALSKVAVESATPIQADAMQDQKMAEGGVAEKPVAMPPPSEAREKAIQYEKQGVPTRSVSQTLSDAASGWWDSPTQKKAEGGQVEQFGKAGLKSEEEYSKKVHQPDTYGGRRTPAAVKPEEVELESEVQKADQVADSERKMYAEPTEMVAQNDSAPSQDKGLANHLGRIIGEYGIAPVVQHLKDEFNRIGGNVKMAADTAGQFVGGMEKGGKFSLTPPPDEPEQQQPMQPRQSIPQPALPIAQQQAPAAMQVPNQAAAQQQDPYGTSAYMDAIQQGIGSQQAGLQQSAAGEMQAAEGKAAADARYIATLQNEQAKFQNLYNTNLKNVNATVADMKANHINPKRYMENLESGQKVAAVIGLALGGFGQGFNGHGNPMSDFINKQIDRDIAAQEKNQGNRATLLHAYQEQFRDSQQASLMTRATLASKYAADIQMAANKAANPVIAGKLLQESGKLQAQSADLVKQATMMKAMLGNATVSGQAEGSGKQPAGYDESKWQQEQQYWRMSNPEFAKKREELHVPGIGDAHVPVDKDTRDKLTAHIKLDQGLADLQNFVNNNTTLVPGTAAYATGQQKSLKLQALIREGVLGTVYREGEQPLLDKMLKLNPAGLMKYLTKAQLAELRSSTLRDFNAEKTKVGLPMTQPPAQQNVGPQPIKGKDGKMYIQQGKYMVPVK